MTDLNADLATIASDALMAVVEELRRGGQADRAGDLIRQAAEIELMSPELQACWGGPFNGQAGRTAIVEEILRVTAPRAVIETGTFRGLSTEWLASHCAAQVWSCEIEERYLLQARHRLAGIGNIVLEHSDSRSFLRRVVSLLDPNEPSFFYLDAHWKADLPLRDEIGIILSVQPRAIVMIDDFRIPEDAGYAWDNYGPGARVDATALDGALPQGASLFIPVLASRDETGAKRGCCVIALDFAETIARCDLLRRRSLSDLMPTDYDGIAASEGEMHHSMLQNELSDDRLVKALRDEITKINLDRAKRLQDIMALNRMIAASEGERSLLKADREIHLRDIGTLTSRIEEIEADRAKRLEDVEKLTSVVEQYREETRLVRDELARHSL